MKALLRLLVRFFKPDKHHIIKIKDDVRSIGKSLLVGGVISAFVPAYIELKPLLIMVFGFIMWMYGILISKE